MPQWENRSGAGVSKPGAYALERAAKAGVESGMVVSAQKLCRSRRIMTRRCWPRCRSHGIDVVVLAGFLSILGASGHRGLSARASSTFIPA